MVPGEWLAPAKLWVMTVQNQVASWIELDGAVNARTVVPGVLLRSDNLQDLSDRDVRTLVDDHGLVCVIDLRTDIEVALEGPGPITREASVVIEHRSLYPDTGGNTDLDAEADGDAADGARAVRPETVDIWRSDPNGGFEAEIPVVRAYMSYLTRRPDSIVAALRTIAAADGAVLVHCAAGKDRTGVVVALALDAVGVQRAVIVEDYLRTGARIEQIMRRLRSSETYRAELEGHDADRHAPVPGAMERVLQLIDERFGGSVAWMTANGLRAEELARLRARLIGDGPAG
jgi:protein tyrosine/serine phosphatase